MWPAATLLVVAACAAPPPPVDQVIAEGAPDGFPSAGQVDAPPDALAPPTRAWWRQAVPEALTETIATSLTQSPIVDQAAARVAAAQAALDIASAERWLDVALAGQASASVDDGGDDDQSGSVGLDATLPLDIFGRLKASRDEQAYRLIAAAADLDDVRLRLAQAVATSYVDAAQAVRERTLLDRQIDASRTLLRLTETRYLQGQASMVDVLQQRQQLASVEQSVPGVDADLRSAANDLAALAGRPPPPDARAVAPDAVPAISDRFAVDAPIGLLRTRPDLLRLEALLAAADRSYAQAVADRLPSFQLSASAVIRTATGNPQALIDGVLSAVWTVFDTGRKRAIVAANRADLEEAAATYLRAWFDAIADVDTLFAEERSARLELAIAQRRLDEAGRLLLAAQRRYSSGATDFLPVLDAIENLQALERELVRLEANLARVRVDLHAALGLPVAYQLMDPPI